MARVCRRRDLTQVTSVRPEAAPRLAGSRFGACAQVREIHVRVVVLQQPGRHGRITLGHRPQRITATRHIHFSPDDTVAVEELGLARLVKRAALLLELVVGTFEKSSFRLRPRDTVALPRRLFRFAGGWSGS